VVTECACGSGRAFEECCGPVIGGRRPAATAAELMRARYCAYATEHIEFLKQTTYPSRRREVDEGAARSWSRESEWKGFEILDAQRGGEGDETGTVEFIARYARDGEDMEHHEVGEFKRRDGVWYFVDGKPGGVETYVREQPKIGRNDPCPCGSGKKYKRCCGRT
jgi:SEC-C motif-containing protein